MIKCLVYLCCVGCDWIKNLVCCYDAVKWCGNETVKHYNHNNAHQDDHIELAGHAEEV